MSRVKETTEEQKWGLLQPEAAMASNSLFSTVTPCQQNFFWGEYHFPAPCCVWIGLGGSGHRKDLGSGGEAWVVELMGFEESGRRCWNWSDVLGPDEWRGSAEVMEDPAVKVQAFVADETPNYHQGFFSFFFVHPKKNNKKRKSAHRDSSIYSM